MSLHPIRGLSAPPVQYAGPLPLLLTASGVGCQACPLAEHRTQIVDGQGPYKPVLMVIGEAPGHSEDVSGNPFVGNSGKLMRGTLGELGLPPEQVWFTNAVRCKPVNDRNPTSGELATCRSWLELEIESIKPQAILCVGKIPERQVADLPPELLSGIPVYHAYHPAHVLRNRSRLAEWRLQVAAAIPPGQLREVPDTQGASPQYQDREPWLERPWIAVDTETDESDPDDGGGARGQKMVCFQVSDGIAAWLYPPDHPLLESLKARKIAVHGAKFDLPLLGIDPHDLDKWTDTQLMAYVLREDQIGLKPQALKHHNLYIPPIQKLIGTGKKRIPFSQALKEQPEAARDYACRDAFGTSLLAESQSRRLAEDPALERYYHEIEKPVLAILMDMEQTGILVDTDALEPLDQLLEAEIEASTRQIEKALGVFKLASGPQLAQALTENGFVLAHETPTGKVATDEASLLSAAGVASKADLDPASHEHQVIAAILDIRSKQKLRTTYVKNLRAARDPDGRIHARFNQTVTNTNRLSSSKPNLQNIPVNGPIQKTMRRIFRAAPGYTLVKADYSQLEVRIYAEYTQEPVLVAAYTHQDHDTRGRDGGCVACDVHQQVANTLGIARSRAKNVLFAAIYGASATKLAETAGVPADRAVAFLATMRERLPSLLTWQGTCAAKLSSRGYLETLLGWRGYFPLYWSPVERDRKSALREAANFPIQGTAAGLVKKLMILAHEGIVAYGGARLLLQVHDEVVYEVPNDEALEFARDLADLGAVIGQVSCNMTVPLVLDVGLGPNWGDLVAPDAWEAP